MCLYPESKYLHDYSTFGELITDDDSRASILKLQAIVHYITKHYFPAVCKEGLNVISSIPVWKSGKSLPSYALTDVAFHVYSKVEITRHNWTHVTPGTEPIIVVLGTTGFRKLPSRNLDFSTGWVVQSTKGFSHGTISISKRVFIEERLLHLLSRINGLTTLIPSTPDMLQGFKGLSLKSWAEHEQRKDRPSKWELQASDGDGYLKYLWEHCEEWTYKLHGNSNMMSAHQGISCKSPSPDRVSVSKRLTLCPRHYSQLCRASYRCEAGLDAYQDQWKCDAQSHSANHSAVHVRTLTGPNRPARAHRYCIAGRVLRSIGQPTSPSKRSAVGSKSTLWALMTPASRGYSFRRALLQSSPT